MVILSKKLLKVLVLRKLYQRYKRRTRKTTRRFYMHPILLNRKNQSNFNYIMNLKANHAEDFKEYMRVTPDQFDELLAKVEPYLCKIPNKHKVEISTGERLAMTLRRLASGDSLKTMQHEFVMGRSTTCVVFNETCRALCNALKDEVLKFPTTEEWGEIIDDFWNLWNYQNCCGALDGKHCRIRAPPNAGSQYYNYKNYHSIVLMALVDARYRFRVVDIGAFGRQSDGGIFNDTQFGQDLSNETVNFPPPRRFPSLSGAATETGPCVIICDAAFKLRRNAMVPYPGNRLTMKQLVHNYRLSRARRCVENAFGILSSVFRIFHQLVQAHPENMVHIVLACCCLHNFKLIDDQFIPVSSQDPTMASYESEDDELQEGPWRMDPHATTTFHTNQIGRNIFQPGAKDIRDSFADFFMSESGKVHYQNRVVNRGYQNRDPDCEY